MLFRSGGFCIQVKWAFTSSIIYCEGNTSFIFIVLGTILNVSSIISVLTTLIFFVLRLETGDRFFCAWDNCAVSSKISSKYILLNFKSGFYKDAYQIMPGWRIYQPGRASVVSVPIGHSSQIAMTIWDAKFYYECLKLVFIVQHHF